MPTLRVGRPQVDRDELLTGPAFRGQGADVAGRDPMDVTATSHLGTAARQLIAKS
jgi:hypothetical protein